MRTDAQRGQALVEAILVAGTLSILAGAVVLIGKLQSVKAAAISASAFLAFTCVVTADRCGDSALPIDIEERTRTLAFSRNPDAELESAGTGTGIGAGAGAAREIPSFWRDRLGEPMFDPDDGVDLRVGSRALDAPAGLLGGVRGGALALLGAGPEHFGLDLGAGLFAAEADVAIDGARLALPLGRGALLPALGIVARTVALADDWNASGPRGDGGDDIEARVDRGSRLAPWLEAAHSVGYAPIRGLIAIAGTLGVEPSASAMRHHVADVEILPPDRVSE